MGKRFLSGAVSRKGGEWAAHLKDDKSRDALNVKGFGDVTLCFCFNLEREQFRVLS